MSDNFAEPISRAATGEICEDDETFEIHNFQIEQWRKKALSGANLSHPHSWASDNQNREPWQFLLYLRANTVRKLLLRPFFLPSAGLDVGIRNLQSAIDLVSETIECIDWLDVSTDIYGRLHPHFQHCLTSACALLSLIVAFVGQRRAQIDESQFAKVSHFVNQNFRTALGLASKYASVSRQSNRLRKHLVSMKDSLRREAFLGPDLPATSNRVAGGQASIAAVFARGESNDNAVHSTSVAAVRQFFPPPFQGLESGIPILAEAPTPGFRNMWMQQDASNGLAFGSPDMLDFSWPLNDPGGFF